MKHTEDMTTDELRANARYQKRLDEKVEELLANEVDIMTIFREWVNPQLAGAALIVIVKIEGGKYCHYLDQLLCHAAYRYAETLVDPDDDLPDRHDERRDNELTRTIKDIANTPDDEELSFLLKKQAD